METVSEAWQGPNHAYLDNLERMTPEELVAIGQNLYGSQSRGVGTWQTRLAEAIGVTTATIRNWAKGRNPMRASDSRHVRLHYHYASQRCLPREPFPTPSSPRRPSPQQ